MDQTTPQNVDDYIAAFPAEVQEILQKIRQIIREAAPEAQETIKYKMPTYVLGGNLVFFAAHKKHVSVYPRPAGDEAFHKEAAVYESGQGTYQFPYNQPIPYELIRKIVQFRVAETTAGAEV
jgi:uncharacterized protein YdhG (YjbR/CyaY superfamily)